MASKPAKYYSSFTVANIHFTVITSTSGIKEIIFNLEKNNSKLINTIQLQPEDTAMRNIYSQLKEYFDGKRKEFDLPLEIEGTDFQKKVWDELLKIPFGTTISYKELAVRLGDEKVIRAAASANGANPFPIVIPCHRVIGSNGSLVGYGGGLKIKEKLLTIEGNRSPGLFD
ncbi:MAG: methylated-DNA--[protein]-cysteine S-methyltransferase [Bacteroidetes bacterium]|nr:methylated-DNA--[protein]-cysteine S-methyltransferase [Bacteroidota bacterium]